MRRLATSRTGSVVAAFEAPTWGVAVLVHGGIALATWNFQHLPMFLAVPVLIWLVAWHGSLRHEVVHGHPTPWRELNGIVAGPPWELWLPLTRYGEWHRAHHQAAALADPRVDPESFYVTAEDWDRRGPIGQALLRLHQTLAGRLMLGPPLMVAGFWVREAQAIVSGDRRRATIWARHLLLVAAVIAWLEIVAGIPFWFYLIAVVWPASALQLLRSFDEHRPGNRSTMRRAEAPLALLFLNNNLHALHHAHPDVAWYRLPALARAGAAAAAGGYAADGYRGLFTRNLFRVQDSPVHPA